ncbi:TPA: hypothetical protein HA238_03545 [Candidatus Micrarchaeota archaeon]|nr:hypothetical protein [Candidatus Micrarchaeota archaeon]
MPEEETTQFSRIKYELGSHVPTERMNAHLQAAGLFRKKTLGTADASTAITELTKDLMHADADIRKSAKDALRHAFNSPRVHGEIGDYLRQSELVDVAEFAMEGLKSPTEEIRCACRFFIGKMIDECKLVSLQVLESSLLIAHTAMFRKYGEDRDISWWKKEVGLRRREIVNGLSQTESGIRRKAGGNGRANLRVISSG